MREEIKKTKNRVKAILEEVPDTRENDMLLYIFYFQQKYGTTDIRFLNHCVKGNEFETVSRCRRKLQAENPFLASGKTIRDLRTDAEEVFREEMSPCRLF